MSSTPSSTGVKAPDWIMDDQSQSQLVSRQNSQIESTSTQGQIAGVLLSRETILLPPHLAQQNGPGRSASSQPEPHPGLHTHLGDNNKDSGRIEDSGNIIFTFKGPPSTMTAFIKTEDLKMLAKDLPTPSATGGTGNEGCSNIKGSGRMEVVCDTGTNA